MAKLFGIFQIPTQGVPKQAVYVKTYTVCWYRRTGEFSSDVEKCYKTFVEHDDAVLFKDALNRANTLIGNKWKTEVTIKES